MLDFLKKMKLILVDILLPVVAFVLSLVALYISQQAQDDVARMEAVKTEYDIYNDLARLQLDNPLMTHLFAFTPAAYRRQAASTKAATSATGNDRLKLLLEEQSLAHYIFTHYEETYFLWQQALGGEDRRRVWLEGNLQYFNKLLCGNPRLLWYWSDNGKKLGQEFAPTLQNYYSEEVAADCPVQPDQEGPFSDQGGTK